MISKSVGDAIATATTSTHAARIATPGVHALDVVRVETVQPSSGDLYVIAGLQEAGKPLTHVFALRFREQAEMNLERFCKSLRGPPEDVLRVLMVVGDALGKTRHGVMRADVNLRTIAEATAKKTKNGRMFLAMDWRAGDYVTDEEVPGTSLFDKTQGPVQANATSPIQVLPQVMPVAAKIVSTESVLANFEESVLYRALVASDEEEEE